LNIASAKRADKFSFATVIGVVLILILTPVLVVNFTLIFKSFVYPNEVPGFLGYKPFIVLTGSMEPAFSSGDLVIVKEVEANNLQLDDIIAFREGNAVITHRIIEFEQNGSSYRFITKGDNNNIEDRRPVNVEQLEGQYIFRIRNLGNFAMFMQTPVGMALFIALPLLSFLLYDITRRTVHQRRQAQQTKNLEAELKKIQSQILTLDRFAKN
jgi:signal peptidase